MSDFSDPWERAKVHAAVDRLLTRKLTPMQMAERINSYVAAEERQERGAKR